MLKFIREYLKDIFSLLYSIRQDMIDEQSTTYCAVILSDFLFFLSGIGLVIRGSIQSQSETPLIILGSCLMGSFIIFPIVLSAFLILFLLFKLPFDMISNAREIREKYKK